MLERLEDQAADTATVESKEVILISDSAVADDVVVTVNVSNADLPGRVDVRLRQSAQLDVDPFEQINQQIAKDELSELVRLRGRFEGTTAYQRKLARLLGYLGDIEGARRILNATSTSRSSSEADQTLLGELLISAGNFSEAKAAFENCDLQTNLTANLGLAYVALKEGNRNAAKDSLTNALSIDYLSYEARLLAGALLLWERSYDHAIRAFKVAAAERPSATAPLVYAAAAYLALGQSNQAIKALRRAVDLKPIDQSALVVLSDVLGRVNTRVD